MSTILNTSAMTARRCSRFQTQNVWYRRCRLLKPKNLFLRDKKGNWYFLAVVQAKKQVDIKALSSVVRMGHLSFGSPDRLKRFLGVEPGSIAIPAIINDPGHAVEVIFDKVL